ncbi:MAG: GldG family protein, partial [Vicinamibacterales bacterium]
RQNKRWDLTAGGAFTLSDQTKKILETLPNPVTIKVFTKGDDFDRFRDRLDQFQYASKKVSVEYIDVYKRPALAERYKIQQEGTVVFEYGARVERATNDTEQDLTNALIKAVQGQEKTVYFVQGHGERDTAGADRRTGYSGIAQALQIDNFKVDKLALAQQKTVPADASVIVLAGPQADYLQEEVDMLREYLQRGGRVLFLLDPPARPDAPPLTNLMALLREWGIEAGNDIVVDVSGRSDEPSVPVAMPPYPAHPALERLTLFTVYPVARSMSPVPGGVNGRTAQPIIETSPRSWAETDIKTLLTTGRLPVEAAKGDKTGPIPLGAAVSAAAPEPAKPENQVEAPKEEEPKKPETRVIAIGDSDFASNGFLGAVGSRDLFMNVTNWLAGQENMIAIRPREAQDRRLSMTADQQRFMMLLTIFIIPGLILLAGAQTWWRRR